MHRQMHSICTKCTSSNHCVYCIKVILIIFNVLWCYSLKYQMQLIFMGGGAGRGRSGRKLF